MNTPEHVAHPLLTLSVALLFAAIFLFGGRAAYRAGHEGRRRFLSFAAGISVAYTFVHVLPALGAIQDLQTEHPTGFYWIPQLARAFIGGGDAGRAPPRTPSPRNSSRVSAR